MSDPLMKQSPKPGGIPCLPRLAIAAAVAIATAVLAAVIF
jgi:hypothetical protein